MPTGATAWLSEQEIRASHNLTTDGDWPPATLEAGLFASGVEASGNNYARSVVDNDDSVFGYDDGLVLVGDGIVFDAPDGGDWGIQDELRLFVPGSGEEFERYLIVDEDGLPAPIVTDEGQPVVFPAGTGLRRVPINVPG